MKTRKSCKVKFSPGAQKFAASPLSARLTYLIWRDFCREFRLYDGPGRTCSNMAFMTRFGDNLSDNFEEPD